MEHQQEHTYSVTSETSTQLYSFQLEGVWAIHLS